MFRRFGGGSISGFVPCAVHCAITPIFCQYLGRETESYDVLSAASGTGCTRSCVNVCKVKLNKEGADCQRGQFGK